MASVRRLKKDIDFITDEIIVECFVYNYLFPEKNEQEISEIIVDTLNMKNNLRDQINKVKPTEETTVKKQFGAIKDELFGTITKLVDRLDKLEK